MKPLSVRSKILLTLIASVVALSFTVYFISTELLLKSYLDIEHEAMREDLRRASDAINEFEGQQMIKLSDWASWDEAYEFAQNMDPQWAEETIYATGLSNLDINAMVWADLEGKVFHIMVVDIAERTEVASSTVEAYFNQHPELIVHESLEDATQGITLLPDGPAIVVSLPLKTSVGEGPSTGSLTFARYLNEAKIKEIAEITHLEVTAFPYDGTDLSTEVRNARAQVEAGASEVIVPTSPYAIVGYTTLQGVDGEPALLIRVETSRPIYTQGIVTLYVFMATSSVALILFGIAVVFLLERLVITRFVKLAKDVDHINEVQDISMRVRGGVKDELGKLADQINQMLSWLSESREKTRVLLEEVKHGKDRAEDMVKVRTKELAEEKARLLASINSLAFGFVIASVDGGILLKNPSLSRIMKLREEPGKIQDIANAFGATFDLMKFCNESLERQVPSEKSDISYGNMFLRVLCAPIFAEADSPEATGTVIGSVLLIEDTTEAKVIQRSREEFFSIASHELRTPLTAIRGNTDLLLDMYKDKLNDPAMRGMLEDINASSGRLISIVNDFLQISRLEQGKMEIQRQPFDLSEVITQVVRTLTELASQKGITLSFESSPIPQVMGDRDRTEEVIENLIGNAIKFTHQGGVTVSVESDGTRVKVKVTDTGIGISEQNQANLFRKFQQASEDLLARDNSQSTGLGLYISKLLMNAMGGAVVLEESQLGKGSTFSFTLPVA
ncbi:MAG: CHASE4 domain-containing protein [Patescibacteria group bacterium]